MVVEFAEGVGGGVAVEQPNGGIAPDSMYIGLSDDTDGDEGGGNGRQLEVEELTPEVSAWEVDPGHFQRLPRPA